MEHLVLYSLTLQIQGDTDTRRDLLPETHSKLLSAMPAFNCDLSANRHGSGTGHVVPIFEVSESIR